MQVLLVANTSKPDAVEAALVAAEWLVEQGVSFEQIASERLVLGDEIMEEWSEKVEEFDLVVSFGGDGTILRVVRLLSGSDIPLLAFNFGGLGFLAGAQSEDLIEALRAAIEEDVSYEERRLIEIEISFAAGESLVLPALNEAVVSRLDAGRVVSLDIEINDKLFHSMRGDGLLVASATGSTAYALSAGGPLVHPDHDGLVIVPISEHSLKDWSLVTGSLDEVTIKPSAGNTQELLVYVDGEPLGPPLMSLGLSDWLDDEEAESEETQELLDAFKMLRIKEVSIRPSFAVLTLVKYGEMDFYQHLRQTFFKD